jgi:hypothetical protein
MDEIEATMMVGIIQIRYYICTSANRKFESNMEGGVLECGCTVGLRIRLSNSPTCKTSSQRA